MFEIRHGKRTAARFPAGRCSPGRLFAHVPADQVHGFLSDHLFEFVPAFNADFFPFGPLFRGKTGDDDAVLLHFFQVFFRRILGLCIAPGNGLVDRGCNAARVSGVCLSHNSLFTMKTAGSKIMLASV